MRVVHPNRVETVFLDPAWNMRSTFTSRLRREIEAELEPDVEDLTDESDLRAFAWWPYRP